MLVDGEKKASVVVPVITLDAVCAERLPAIIKVDVEGFEHAVVEGVGMYLQTQLLKR